jgi:hypothetical protein
MADRPKQTTCQSYLLEVGAGTNHNTDVALRATAGEAKGASSITTWQATGNKPSNTEQTEQQYSTATQTATGAVATKPHKQTISSSTTQAETTAQQTSYPHAEPATQSAEPSM